MWRLCGFAYVFATALWASGQLTSVKFSLPWQTKFTASLLKDKIYKTWARGLVAMLNRSLPSLS
jgi:hypothetical protein